MATEKLRDPEIALAYVEGHSKHPDFGYAIAALHKSLASRLNVMDEANKIARTLAREVNAEHADRLDALDGNLMSVWGAIKDAAQAHHALAEQVTAIWARLRAVDVEGVRERNALEKLVGKNYEHLRGGILESDDKANALAERVAELEASRPEHHGELILELKHAVAEIRNPRG